MDATPDSRRGRRAFRSASHLVSGRLVTLLVLVLSAFLIPRLLGAETYGLYASVLAMAAILEALSSGGLQMAEIRFVAPAWQSGERERALVYGSTIWFTRLGLAVLASCIAVPWLLSTGHLTSGLVVALLAAYVGLRCAFEATRHLHLSYGLPGRMAWLEVARALSTLLLVLAVFPLGALDGVFVGLPCLQALLLGVAAVGLLSTATLRWRRFDARTLRSLALYSGFTWVGAVALMLQSQFAVYAAARWVSLAEAGVLAVTVQMYAALLGLLTAARTSVLPTIGEIHESGEREELERWSAVLVRWSAFLATAGLLTWAVLGDYVALVLPSRFAPIHEAGTLMLAAVVFVALGFVGNGVLYVSGRSGAASLNRVVFAGLTVGGVTVLVLAKGETTAVEIALAYFVAGVVFWLSTAVSARRRLGLQLPVWPALILVAPGVLAWPLTAWEATLPTKVLAVLGLLMTYLAAALLVRQIRLEEVRALSRLARHGR